MRLELLSGISSISRTGRCLNLQERRAGRSCTGPSGYHKSCCLPNSQCSTEIWALIYKTCACTNLIVECTQKSKTVFDVEKSLAPRQGLSRRTHFCLPECCRFLEIKAILAPCKRFGHCHVLFYRSMTLIGHCLQSGDLNCSAACKFKIICDSKISHL